MEENIYDKTCVICGKTFIDKGNARYGLCKNCSDDGFTIPCQGVWIEYQDDYIRILKEILLKRKTPIYHIESMLSKDEIGQIKWYGAWRKFCFYPNGDTIWDNKCLEQIIAFLNQVNTKKKNKEE